MEENRNGKQYLKEADLLNYLSDEQSGVDTMPGRTMLMKQHNLLFPHPTSGFLSTS